MGPMGQDQAEKQHMVMTVEDSIRLTDESETGVDGGLWDI